MWLVRISPAIGRPQTDFAPCAANCTETATLGKHCDPKKLSFSGLSHGFKSLLLHQLFALWITSFSGDDPCGVTSISMNSGTPAAAARLL